VIGSIRYLVNRRPDISYAVGIASRYMGATDGAVMMVPENLLACS
jgi:hypothetical protein